MENLLDDTHIMVLDDGIEYIVRVMQGVAKPIKAPGDRIDMCISVTSSATATIGGATTAMVCHLFSYPSATK